MKESQVIKILIGLCMILVVVGGLTSWQQGWIKEFSLASILESSKRGHANIFKSRELFNE